MSKHKYNLTLAKRQRVFERDNQQCRICGKDLCWRTKTVDHIIPRSKGGTSEDGNLQILCRRCNTRKGNEMPKEDA